MQDYFKKDVLNDVISSHQQERDERREPLREKKRRNLEKARIAEENRNKRRKVWAITVIVLVIIGALVGNSVVEIYRLSKEKAAAVARLSELEDQIARLNEELSRVTSNEYVEQQARQQLRMIYPGEVLYIVLDE